MRMRLIALIVAGYLASAALAKADDIYTFNDPGNYSWSFDVPGIITTTTTITSFVSTNIVPTGAFGVFGCTVVDSVVISNPTTTFAIASTNFSGSTCSSGADVAFGGAKLNSFGTFTNGNITLTIAPSAATPEPSSLLLLGAGLIGTYTARRRLARSRDRAPERTGAAT